MSYQPLTKEQFQSARAKYTPEQITAFEKTRQAKESVAQTPAPVVTPQEPSLLDKLGTRFGQATHAIATEQNPIRSNLRVLGAGAGAVNDTLGAVISPFIKSAVDTVSDSPIVQKFANLPAVSKGLDATNAGIKTATGYAKDAFHTLPTNTQQDLRDVGNIASFLPVGKGASVAKDIVSKAVEPALTPVINTARTKAVDSLEQTYEAIQSGTTAGKKKLDKIGAKTEALNNAGTTGKLPQRTLAEAGIIPEREGTKLNTFDQAKTYRDTIAPLREANKKALREVGLSNAPVSLNNLESRAVEYARTPQNINSGRIQSMERDIRNEFTNLRKEYPQGTVPLDVVDDIKSARWNNVFGNKGLIEADVLKKDSEYAIAKSLQKSIEDVATKAGHTDVAQLNRDIGDRLEASKFLEELNGKTLKGGRVLKYVTTLIGSSMGQTIPGKIIGALGGNIVGELIIAHNVASPVKRMLLKNLEVKDPASYTRTIQWLKKQNLDRETRLMLPEGAPRPLVTPYKDTSGINPVDVAKNNAIQNERIRNNTLRLPAPESTATGVPIKLNAPASIEKGVLPSPQYQGIKKPVLLPERASAIQLKSPKAQQTNPAITKQANIPPTLPPIQGKSTVLPVNKKVEDYFEVPKTSLKDKVISNLKDTRGSIGVGESAMSKVKSLSESSKKYNTLSPKGIEAVTSFLSHVDGTKKLVGNELKDVKATIQLIADKGGMKSKFASDKTLANEFADKYQKQIANPSPLTKEALNYKSLEEFVKAHNDPLKEFKSGLGIKEEYIARGGVKDAINEIGGIKNVKRGTVNISDLETSEKINTHSDRYKEVLNQVKNGERAPIIIDEYGVIHDGHHRYEAYKELGIKSIPVVAPKSTLFVEPISKYKLTDIYNKAHGKVNLPKNK